jgi:hypothetical protein
VFTATRSARSDGDSSSIALMGCWMSRVRGSRARSSKDPLFVERLGARQPAGDLPVLARLAALGAFQFGSASVPLYHGAQLGVGGRRPRALRRTLGADPAVLRNRRPQRSGPARMPPLAEPERATMLLATPSAAARCRVKPSWRAETGASNAG